MSKREPPADEIALVIADIYELSGQLRARGDRLAATVGQTQARWQVLSAASTDPRLSVPQIARRLGITRQAVQRVADLLVADGLVVFADNPDHKASPHLVPTSFGQETLARLTRAARGFNNEMAAHLGAVDLAALRRDLRSLLDGIKRFNPGE